MLAVGKFELHLGIDALQTLCAVGIVFGSQATTYVVRGHQQIWGLYDAISHDALWQICPWNLSFRSFIEVGTGAFPRGPEQGLNKAA